MAITVSVGTVPGRIEQVALNGERTVSAALSILGLSSSGYTVTVNGVTSALNATLNDGDRVLLTRNAKGN